MCTIIKAVHLSCHNLPFSLLQSVETPARAGGQGASVSAQMLQPVRDERPGGKSFLSTVSNHRQTLGSDQSLRVKIDSQDSV